MPPSGYFDLSCPAVHFISVAVSAMEETSRCNQLIGILSSQGSMAMKVSVAELSCGLGISCGGLAVEKLSSIPLHQIAHFIDTASCTESHFAVCA